MGFGALQWQRVSAGCRYYKTRNTERLNGKPMSDILKKHRIIGIRSALRPLKDEGLISQKTNYPAEAVSQLIRLKKKADGATRHRKARTDATIASITKKSKKFLSCQRVLSNFHTQMAARRVRTQQSVRCKRSGPLSLIFE